MAIVRRLLADPTMRTTLVFGLSGLAFALGNLFLARTMDVNDYGKLALAIALFNVFGLLTPLGVDQAILRHRIDPGPHLLLLVCITGTAVGLLIGGVLAAPFGGWIAKRVNPDRLLAFVGALVTLTSGYGLYRALS